MDLSKKAMGFIATALIPILATLQDTNQETVSRPMARDIPIEDSRSNIK